MVHALWIQSHHSQIDAGSRGSECLLTQDCHELGLDVWLQRSETHREIY